MIVLVGAAGTGSRARAALVRATYLGCPGHPVLIGRNHWLGVLAATTADEGALVVLPGPFADAGVAVAFAEDRADMPDRR